MDIDRARIETQHVVFLQRLFRPCTTSGAARLDVEHGDGGTGVTVQPTLRGRARIATFAENGSEVIYLTVGENTTLEVALSRSRYTRYTGLEELVALLNAVVEGRFVETTRVDRRGRIVSSSAVVTIGEAESAEQVELRESTVRLNPIARTVKRVHHYLPYGCELDLAWCSFLPEPKPGEGGSVP
jgi:hypothetical protein